MSDGLVKTVDLSRTYAAHDEAIKAVRLKEPTADDYFDFGEPMEIQRTEDGLPVVIENRVALKGYIERCLVGIDIAIVGTFAMEDGRRIRNAMLDFFRLPGPSDGSSTTSSSNADGAPATSAP